MPKNGKLHRNDEKLKIKKISQMKKYLKQKVAPKMKNCSKRIAKIKKVKNIQT